MTELPLRVPVGYPQFFSLHPQTRRDQNEQVVSRGISDNNPIVEQINTPSGLAAGNVRMRVVVSHQKIKSPCDQVENGEVEDYTVSIDNLPDASFSAAGADAEEQTVTVYPNPVSAQLHIAVDEVTEIIITTLPGTVVHRGTEKVIDVSHLKQGLYRVIIRAGLRTYQRRFVKL
ncbi:MAG TPA: GEVED domain-containing protein [Chryseosolibacter sp.]